MTSVPGGTLTGAPSIVRLIKPSAISRQPSANQYGCAFAGQVRLELSAELLDAAHDRRRARIGPRADRFARHVLREIASQIEVFRLPLPRQDALEDLRCPRGAFPALRALRARLVRIELRQAHDLVDHVGGVVEYDHSARAEHRPSLDHAFVVEQTGFGFLTRQDRNRRAAGDACLERSEEHTSELQSLAYLVCRLLLEK